MLTAPLDLSRRVYIQSDSSKDAMGWCISQADLETNIRRVVALGSRAWPEAARRYPSNELETGALLFELRRRRTEFIATPRGLIVLAAPLGVLWRPQPLTYNSTALEEMKSFDEQCSAQQGRGPACSAVEG